MKKLFSLAVLVVAFTLGINHSDIQEILCRLFPTEAPLPQNIKKPNADSDENKAKTKGKAVRTKMQLEIPSFLTDRPEEVVWHTAYTVSFNRKHKLPNWVAWELTDERTRATEPRNDHFCPDPDVKKGTTAEDSDYKGSGYDRGHMCPSADNKISAQTMAECCYLSNICPQLHSLNNGDWKELEEKSRKWARKYGIIYIVCGPIINKGKHNTIGANRVTIPDGFFKVILRMNNDGTAKAIGFIYPHEQSNRPMQDYAVSVDQVESRTGINFFSKLPKEVERKAEAECNFNDWK
ncbi:MAG: DNA/RNA non-specific endonuclease [Clostridium sp.]|nr:DNA/RNA non-specific endonuclease [Clostridium sp.]